MSSPNCGLLRGHIYGILSNQYKKGTQMALEIESFFDGIQSYLVEKICCIINLSDFAIELNRKVLEQSKQGTK